MIGAIFGIVAGIGAHNNQSGILFSMLLLLLFSIWARFSWKWDKNPEDKLLLDQIISFGIAFSSTLLIKMVV